MGIELGSAFGKITIDGSGVQRGVDQSVASLEGMKGKLSSLSSSLQQLGGVMTATFTVPIALAGGKAFKVFADYEQSLNVLKQVSHATSEEMELLSAKAKELGADLELPGTSAADAADAMAELAKAGLDVNEVLAASKGVLQLSVAGQISNAEAARITANALNAFKLEGEDAARVADLLAASALASTGEVKEMADALQMSATVASFAGMKIEDLITAISLMSNAGIQGSDAGTSIKQMLLSLEAPTKKSKTLMQELGIQIYDSAGNMKSMRDIIDIFSKQLSGLTMQQRNAALATIFGSDAVRAANVILMGGTKAFDDMSLAVNKSGAAAGLAASMMQGLTGSVENIKSAFDTAAIAAIEPFKDSLKVLLDFVAKALNAFAALPEPVRVMIVVFLALLAAVGPLLIILATFLGVVANIVVIFSTLGIGVGAVTTAVVAAGGALAGFSFIALSTLGAILLLATGPALLYFAFKNNFLGITTTVKQLWEIIKFYFSQMMKWIVDSFTKIKWDDLGKNMLWGIANGMLFGIPNLILAATKAARSVLETFDKELDMHSPSKALFKRGVWSGQGYTGGLENSVKPNEVAKMLARPVQGMSNSQMQNVNMNFAEGLTLRQVQRMIDNSGEKLMRTLDRAIVGAL